MNDWDVLFLHAAGKGTISKLKRTSLEFNQSDNHDDIKAITKVPLNNSFQSKRAKLVQVRGPVCQTLSEVGFRLSEAADFRSKSTYAACYEMIDLWKEQKKAVTPVQSIIRAMFIILRNCRAIGYAPFKKSATPIRHAYRRKKQRVYNWLIEMKTLAASCHDVTLTRQHIQDSIKCITSLSKDEGESDQENSSDSIELTNKTNRQHLNAPQKRKNQTRNGRAICLRLIGCLDAIYGELLVASLDSGVSLPDPRLYLESLSGQVADCEKGITTMQIICNNNKNNNRSCDSSSSSSSSGKLHYSNPLQRYLELRAIEAVALNITALTKAAVELEGLSAGPDEKTMRGIDPISCPTVRAWWHACRFRIAAWAAFACPNLQAITALKCFSKEEGIIEVGAGVGYWAYILRNAGVDVLAHDKQPPINISSKYKKIISNEYHGKFPAWSEVLNGDTANPNKTNRVLLICYPPPDSPMAVRALQGFSGDRLAYVGEMRGDTGTLEFESRLRSLWDLIGNPISLPNFSNTCYTLTMWQRKLIGKNNPKNSAQSPPLWPFNCCSCAIFPYAEDVQTSPSYFYRDRLTRAVWACSPECANSEKSKAALRVELEVRHIGYGSCEPEGKGNDKVDNFLWKKISL